MLRTCTQVLFIVGVATADVTLPRQLVSGDEVTATFTFSPKAAQGGDKGQFIFGLRRGLLNLIFRVLVDYDLMLIGRMSVTNVNDVGEVHNKQTGGVWPLGDGLHHEHVSLRVVCDDVLMSLYVNNVFFTNFTYGGGWTLADGTELVTQIVSTGVTLDGVWMSPEPDVQWSLPPGGDSYWYLPSGGEVVGEASSPTLADCVTRATEGRSAALNYDHLNNVCQLLTTSGPLISAPHSTHMMAMAQLYP